MKMTVDPFKFHITVACTRLFMLLERVKGSVKKQKGFNQKENMMLLSVALIIGSVIGNTLYRSILSIQGVVEILHFHTLQTLAHARYSNVLARTATAKASAAIM